MNSECKEYKLGDIGIFEYGKLPDKKLIGLGDYKIFTGYKITDKYPVFNCNEGDIVIVARGVGGTGDVKLAPRKCYLTNLSIKITLNEKIIDKKYFYYNYLLSNLKYLDSGSVQSQITISDLKNITLKLPDIKIQKDISLILSTIDSKILINNNINQNLECISQTLFKSWFVDFNPVKAKIAAKEKGKDPKLAAMIAISGKTVEEINQLPADKRKELADTADLFPDEMGESELGDIPKGWKVKPLDKIAFFLNGLALQKYPIKDDEAYLPVIKIAQLKKGNSLGAEKASATVPNDFVINNGDVIFSWSGSLFADVWCGGKGALNQHLFKVTSTNYPKWFYYQWILFHLPKFQRIAVDKAVTMGHIKREHLSQAKCIVPESILLTKVTRIFAKLLDKSIMNKIESSKLAEIRNCIIPKLISGEVLLLND